MTIVFVFKNGYELRMKCENFSCSKNRLGELMSWKADGITESQSLYMNLNEVICVYRVTSDEAESEVKDDD